MNKITDQIWLGNSHDSRDLGGLKAAGIKAVLNMAWDLDCAFGHHQGLTVAKCGLADGPGNELAAYYAGVSMLSALVKSSAPVLVHCHMGRSRSAVTVMMFLNVHDRAGFDHWRDYVKARRPQIDPHPAHREIWDRMDFDALGKLIHD